MKILTLLGSLRADSFSKKLASAALALAPEGIELIETDGGKLPLYNQDLDGDDKPAAVLELLEQVNQADGLLFITPEFNYGIPGTLKNAIDWASRPAYRSPMKAKPSAIVSHSISPFGGIRVHSQLADVLAGTLTPVFVAPSYAIAQTHEKFDESGALTDEITRVRIERLMTDFPQWIEACAKEG